MTSRPPLTLKPVLAALATALACSGCFADPAATTADGGRPVLRVALPWPPAQAYSPYGDDGTILSRLGVTESLTRLDASGSAVPGLATEWRRVTDTRWELDLRPDVTFHDGTRLDPAAVVSSLDAAAGAAPVPAGLEPLGLTASPVDADTVRLETRVADPALPLRLSSPHLPILSQRAFDGGPVDPRGAGTGPFRLAETSGVVAARLVAHDGYWDGTPRTGEIDVRFLPDASSRVAAFSAGEVEIAHTVSAADVGVLPGEVVEVPLPRSVLVYLNQAGPALDTAGERAAVAAVVDRELIAESIFEGRVDPAEGIFGPATPWAADRAVPDRPEPTPIREPLTIATYPERPELPQVADAIAAALRAEGIRVTQTVRSYANLETDLLAGEFDLVVGSRSYALATGEPVDYLRSDFGCSGSYNLARVCDPAVERELDRLARADDVASRRRASLDVERAVLGTGVVVPVVHERARHAVAAGVTGLAEDPYERRFVTEDTELS